MKRCARIALFVGLALVGVLAVVFLRSSQQMTVLVPESVMADSVLSFSSRSGSGPNTGSMVSRPFSMGVEKGPKQEKLGSEVGETQVRVAGRQADTEGEEEDKGEREPSRSQSDGEVPGNLLSNEDKAPVDRRVIDDAQSSFPRAPTIGPPLQRPHNARQEAVVNAFKHAWMGYTKFAWGKDELAPISKRGISSFHMGLTIIDSLDTLWLMGMREEFVMARNWVANSLNFATIHREVSVFETNIRVLGGLLSAYHLSNDAVFLKKAVELGDRLLPAFRTATGIPYGLVVLNQENPKRISSVACVAEMGSLQLEFRDLSHSTGDPKYQRAVDRALDAMQSHMSDGIASQEVYISTGIPKHTVYTVGARTDSYYEYLIKQWIQSGKTEEKFREWYSKSATAIMTKFVKYSQPHHMAFLPQLHSKDGNSFHPKMDHLSCFAAGMLALGYLHGFPEAHLVTAQNLTHTCYQMYHQSPTGLSPDEVTFNTNKQSSLDFRASSSANFQRPETAESLFVLYRVTKDARYRDWGWEILQAFENHSKVASGGYASLSSVSTPNPSKRDKMESFFLAETLKYLFLLFTDDSDILRLDQWVFNTEAHPLPVWTR